jgi:hypothetical protein
MTWTKRAVATRVNRVKMLNNNSKFKESLEMLKIITGDPQLTWVFEFMTKNPNILCECPYKNIF